MQAAAAAGLVVCGGRSAAAGQQRHHRFKPGPASRRLHRSRPAGTTAEYRNLPASDPNCLREHLVTNYLPKLLPGAYLQAYPRARTAALVGFRARRPEARPTHARWLKQYLPLVDDGTWAWLEIGQSDLFSEPLPRNVVASAFANRELHLVLANYGATPAEVTTANTYRAVGGAAGTGTRWHLDPRSLCILRRRGEVS